jgi:DNA polymerase III subunit gamma/tau
MNTNTWKIARCACVTTALGVASCAPPPPAPVAAPAQPPPPASAPPAPALEARPAAYPKMAPVEAYLMERDAEIALARSAAPATITAGPPSPPIASTAIRGASATLSYSFRQASTATISRPL